MNEQEQEARLAAAFRAAVADAPPPAFDARDVVAVSRRITRRRRSAVAGAALAVLAVAGVGITAGVSGGGGDLTTASAGSAPEAARAPAPAGGPSDASELGAPDAAAAPVPAVPPEAEAPVSPPLGPGDRECADRQDPALRALLEQALPEVAGAPEAATTAECRPGGERGVALEVRDGAAAGLLSVTYLPPGKVVEPPGIAEEPDAVIRSAPTASGGTVLVVSRAERAGDPSPFADRLDAVVAYVAPRL